MKKSTTINRIRPIRRYIRFRSKEKARLHR